MIHRYGLASGGGGARKLIHNYQGKIFNATEARSNNVSVNDVEGLVIGDRIMTRRGERTITAINGNRITWNQSITSSRNGDRYVKSVLLSDDDTYKVDLKGAKDLFIFGTGGNLLPRLNSASDSGIRIWDDFMQTTVFIDGRKLTHSTMSFSGGYSWIYGAEKDGSVPILYDSAFISLHIDADGLISSVRGTSALSYLPFIDNLIILGA